MLAGPERRQVPDTSHPRFDLSRELSALELAGFIGLVCSFPELEYLFRHTLVQDAAYASLVKADRQALHRMAGEALERLYPDRLEEYAPQLGLHFSEAGDEAHALKYLTLAGDSAYAAFANAEAAERYTRALEIARRQVHGGGAPNEAALARLRHLFLRCGRAWEIVNRYDRAIAVYLDMEALAQSIGDRPLELAAVLAQTTAQAVIGPAFNPQLAASLLERSTRLADDLGDAEAKAKIAWQRMLLGQYTGDTAGAALHGEQAITLTRDLGLDEQLAYVLDDMVRIYLNLGRIDQARAALAEAEVLWRRLNVPYMLAGNLGSASLLKAASGDLEDALRLSNEAHHYALALGHTFGIGLWHLRGSLLVEQGDVERGIRLLEEGLRLCEAEHIPIGAILLGICLALALESIGAFEAGLSAARRAERGAIAGMPPTLAWVKAVLARLCLANGQVAEAQALLNSPEVQGIEATFKNNAHYAWEAGCLLHLALGEPDQALALSEYALAELRPHGLRLNVLDMLTLQGKALAAAGRAGDARAAYEEARALAEEIGSRRALWPALAALARLAEAEGDHAEAYQLRRQARKVVEHIADHMQTPELLDSFFNMPDVKGIMASEH